MNKYYLIDFGQDSDEEVLDMASVIVMALKSKGYHVATCVTDLKNSFGVVELTEDEFLDCF